MARIVFAASAYADSAAILTYLAAQAGRLTALKYDLRFEKLFDRLAIFPKSGAPRPAIGGGIRIGIVAPYIIIYQHTHTNNTVTVLRIVHGRKRISGALLAQRLALELPS